MMLSESVLVSISECFYVAQDDKIVKAVALTSNNLSNQDLSTFFIPVTASLKKCTEEKEISNIVY